MPSVKPEPLIAPVDWYDGAFSPLVAQFWRAAVPVEETNAEVLFLDTLIGPAGPPGSRKILDVMCGSARIARPLAELGYGVTGLDLSPAMLAEAMRDPLPPTLTLVQGDMCKLDQVNAYDGAYCFGNSLGYIAHDDTISFLDRLARALKPGARFVIETGGIAESVLPDFRADLRLNIAGFRFRATNRYDLTTGILHTDFRLTRGSEQVHFQGRQSIYTLGEFNRMMFKAGFVPVSFYAAPDFRPFKLGAERLMAVYERAGQ